MNELTKYHRERWFEDLESGEFTQVRYYYGKSHLKSYCAIGLIGRDCIEPLSLEDRAELIGVHHSFVNKIVDMNDDDHMSFSEIAEWARRHINEY